MSDRVAAMLGVALEATGTKWGDETVQYVLSELAGKDEGAVLVALRASIKRCKYRLTLADILECLPSQRPEHRLLERGEPPRRSPEERAHYRAMLDKVFAKARES